LKTNHLATLVISPKGRRPSILQIATTFVWFQQSKLDLYKNKGKELMAKVYLYKDEGKQAATN
jgi:hypothetical protein